MKNQFDSYDIALQLKELGFNEDCICEYNTNKILISKVYHTSGKDCECKWDKYDNNVRAPLHQQTIEFLENKFNGIGLIVFTLHNTNENEYNFLIYLSNNNTINIDNIPNTAIISKRALISKNIYHDKSICRFDMINTMIFLCKLL